MRFRFATWNVNSFKKAGPLELLSRVECDLLALQKVTQASYAALVASGLFRWSAFSPTLRPPQPGEGLARGLGCALFGQAPFSLHSFQLLANVHLPERTLVATLETPTGPLTACSFHAPPAADWGEVKPQTFVRIANWLADYPQRVIFGMDANTPAVDHPESSKIGWHWKDEPVLLGPDAHHTSRDVLRTYLAAHPEEMEQIRRVRPEGPLAISYDTGKQNGKSIPRRYDCICATPDLQVERVEYLYEEGLQAGSDHALVIATMRCEVDEMFALQRRTPDALQQFEPSPGARHVHVSRAADAAASPLADARERPMPVFIEMQGEGISPDLARSALESLVIDNPEIERLKALLDQFNMFEAVGAVRQELRHSDFLAFLLHPQQSHGLGDTFLKRLVQKALGAGGSTIPITPLDLDIWSLDEVLVLREWQNIDILLLDKPHQVAIIIENKIASSEHSNQLQRYRQIVQRHYPDWSLIGLYLTPDGELPSDESYLPVSYSLICQLLERLAHSRSSTLGPDVLMAITHYTKMLRRHIVGESEIAELCRRIYQKHQRALDLIYEYRPDRQAEIREVLERLISNAPGLVLDASLGHGVDWARGFRQLNHASRSWSRCSKATEMADGGVHGAGSNRSANCAKV